VPRHHFEQDSPVFRQLFSDSSAMKDPYALPLNGVSKVDFISSFGFENTKDHPLSLSGISKTEFVSFLKLICPKHFSRREELSSMDWASILKLSTLWQFEEARQAAIEKLTPSESDDPIQTILLAKVHNVPQWYSSGLRSLAERKDPLTVDEVERLGLELSLKVTQMHGKVEGFKIAESRFNQAIHSMTTSFTYDDFWGTVVSNADDWLLPAIPRSPSRPMIPSPKSSSSLQSSISILLPDGSPDSKPCTEYSLSAGLQPCSPGGLSHTKQQSDLQPPTEPCSPTRSEILPDCKSPSSPLPIEPDSEWDMSRHPQRPSPPSTRLIRSKKKKDKRHRY